MYNTRKSSCVNTRGIPPAAYQLLHLLSYDHGGGGYLIPGWVTPPPGGGYPSPNPIHNTGPMSFPGGGGVTPVTGPRSLPREGYPSQVQAGWGVPQPGPDRGVPQPGIRSFLGGVPQPGPDGGPHPGPDGGGGPDVDMAHTCENSTFPSYYVRGW